MKIKIWIDGVLRNATSTEIKALEMAWEIQNPIPESPESKETETLVESDTEYYKNLFTTRK